MSNVVNLKQPTDNPSADLARAESIATTIRVLFGELPLTVQEHLLEQLSEIVRPIPAPRAGEVLGAVIHFLGKRPNSEWTVQELKRAIDRHGIEATAKEIYNALGYLTRKNKIQRTGHGRYAIDGIEVITSDELGGPPSRHEIDDT